MLNGITYSASDPIEWKANVIRGSVSLDDDQNPGLPGTISNGGTWNYTEQYTCSTTKTEYNSETHQYTFGECNTAVVKSGETTLDSSTASNTIDCLTYPDFRALNASVTAKQAELSFAMLQTWMDQNPKLEKHIRDINLRPYPMVKFQNGSEFTFRTAGQGAQFIRGFEYDRINVDEPQLPSPSPARWRITSLMRRSLRPCSLPSMPASSS